MTALDLTNATVRYGGTIAVDKLSIRVAGGEVVALVGANGAGKSSTLKALLGLVPLRDGSIRLDGQSIDRLPTRARIRAGLSLSPEGRHVFPDLTVEDNLNLGYIGADPVERSMRRDELYDLFPRLKERARQAAGTMSGGEQQMLAIARAMMAGPKLLLLDEPTLGLAPIVVQEIAAFVRRIRERGLGVILAEQNADMALSIADRAYVLQGGASVIEGPAAKVAADPEVRRAYLGI